MAKVRTVFQKLAPEKIGKTIRLEAELWKSVESLETRIKELQLPVVFDVSAIIEEAVSEAVREGHRELDAMKDASAPRSERATAA